MSVVVLAAASLLGGLLHPAPPPTTTQVYGEGDWRLTVIADTFTHQVRCTLENHNGRNPDITAVPGALAFRVGRGLDTSDAWYKIDNWPARPWRDMRAELIATGALAQSERLDNPSGGLVQIPLEALKTANTVTILPHRRTHLRVFVLAHVEELFNAARAFRCNFATQSQ